jgi:hypothetical protein
VSEWTFALELTFGPLAHARSYFRSAGKLF